MTEEIDVHVTATAKSKAFRMYTERELVDIARSAYRGDLRTFQKGNQSEFHALSEDYAVVIKPENGGLVVITQMHQHEDYNRAEVYRYVDSIRSASTDDRGDRRVES
ncbi:hypothetical protein PhiCh1p82 [Natrialba phage PhiCh1]|uniref:Virus protein phiCh1-VP81 n=2 Tax=root TaxID=1 RepID=D3T2D3_NATMM|nr:hypothetical protein [Natrialba magadii]NP_665999.1 hypothetical protein PhiCh1p82 [Natrialba phage PhiCh1]YP_010078107.1 uncharacterized protein KMC42_gp77 [Natrialba phage PhiCh1]AAM88755.1 unknown [Natrialba phage PhiCh1]ADD07742.1 virus protein phiCh1-VP81 [Natrialba magadii ATCC 43099]ELY22989.1 hypothetical protein C500_21035 [Natrialba magadii ATCC 43099]QBJ01258.1 uncharacterized protein PhiCh1_380 [Natrialba phage PhiCh1]